ncbi:MAG: hypothetical protein ACJ768_06005 [Gaiellaceae bacterium]
MMAIFARAIEITSRSRVRFTLADYGKNAENVQRVAGWLAGPRPR